MEDNSSESEYAWSVWLLSLYKSVLISSLIGSPWFCGATTQRKTDSASVDAHPNALAAYHCVMFRCASQTTHRRKKESSAMCGVEIRRYYASPVSLARSLLVGCSTSQQHATVSQGRICEENFMCCHTVIEVADQAFFLNQSQHTDTGPTSPSADPISQVPDRVAHAVPIFKSLVWLDPEKRKKKKVASVFRTRDLPLSRHTP